MGKIQTKWRQSLSRRSVLRSLSTFVAGSSLRLHAQQDPHRLQDARRALGIDEMISTFDFEPVFHASVPRPVFNYTAMGTDSEFTVRRNREAFEWVDIVAEGTIDVSSVNTSSEMFGRRLDDPILVSPTSGHQLVHPDGEKATHQGATAAGTPMIVSNVSSLPIEEIAQAATGPLWFQFYPKQDMDLSRRTLERAQTSGCQCIVVTIDQQSSYFTRSLLDRNLGGARQVNRSRRRRTPPRNPYRVRDSRLWYEWEYLDQIHPYVEVPMLAKGVPLGRGRSTVSGPWAGWDYRLQSWRALRGLFSLQPGSPSRDCGRDPGADPGPDRQRLSPGQRYSQGSRFRGGCRLRGTRVPLGSGGLRGRRRSASP